MDYTIEELYKQVGRDDRLVILTFKPDSPAWKKYGQRVVAELLYSANEREKLEREYLSNTLGNSSGKVKAKDLTGGKLNDEQATALANEGVDSSDIAYIDRGAPGANRYHQKTTRQITTLNIPMEKMPKGGDYNWMYGFKKDMVKKGVALMPSDREWYLAMKKFFEEKNLTAEEVAEMTIGGKLRPEIEDKFLEIKLEREVSTPEEEQRLMELMADKVKRNWDLVKKEVNDAGLKMDDLLKRKPAMMRFLFKGTDQFNPEPLNFPSKRPIYIDFQGFLHVFLRHVAEFEIGGKNTAKSKFFWAPNDIVPVIKIVISAADDEIQNFWDKNPGKRFSKYGDKAYYFEGDYYTFHIEGNGRLSTFHRSSESPEPTKNNGNKA